MATKKTRDQKSLRQLAESLPPAYELHRSGGTKVGKVSEELQEKYQLEKDRDKKIMADPEFPKGCILMDDHVTIWRPNIYRAEVNHYRRLRNAYALKGMKGVTDYLQAIHKSQLERRERLEKEKKVDPTGDKLFGNDNTQPRGVEQSFAALNQTQDEIQTQETLPNAE